MNMSMDQNKSDKWEYISYHIVAGVVFLLSLLLLQYDRLFYSTSLLILMAILPMIFVLRQFLWGTRLSEMKGYMLFLMFSSKPNLIAWMHYGVWVVISIIIYLYLRS